MISGLGVSPRAALAAALLLLCTAAAAPALDGKPADAAAAADDDAAVDAFEQAPEIETRPYYVEFRVADNGLYGHSYVAYGRLNAAGQPASADYADIHPTGELPSLVLGHFIPMKAATTPARATPRRKVASRYLRTLTAAEYRKLTAVIARTRAARHEWSIVDYNCNDFVAEVARGIDLQTPNTLVLPYEFIPELQAMNEPPSDPAQASSTIRPVPPAAVPRASGPQPAMLPPVGIIASRPVRPARVPGAARFETTRPVPPAPSAWAGPP
jgi:hypothetical protein